MKQKPLSTRQRLLQSRQRRSRRVDDDIPPVPPAPEIPASMRATITRSGFKLLQRMRSHPELQSGEPSSSRISQLATVLASKKASSSAKLVKQPVQLPARPLTRPKASHGQVRDSFSLRTSSLPEAFRNSQQTLYSQRAPSTQSVDRPTTIGRPESYAGQEQGRRSSLPKVDVKYSMREPRLSTMEYARLYFVEEANAKKEKRECELPPPKKAWLWGQNWENFLVLPKIPLTIRRRFSLGNNDENKKTINLAPLDKGHESDADSVETVKGTMSVPAKPPRLSLNLDTMASGLTTMMNVPSSEFRQASHVSNRTKICDEVVLSSGEQNSVEGSASAAGLKENNVSSIENVQTLPPTSTVSSMSSNEREDEDLYSDDRHLWPSPMSQREARCASVSLISEEPSTAVRKDNQSTENTAPRVSEDDAETSSVYSNESSKTALFVGDATKGTGDTPRTPGRPHRPAKLTTPGDESPVRPGIPFSYSCASFNSLSSDRSPLTHFPIAVEQRSRATTDDMVQGILTQSGGRLRVEDARQVQVVESKHDAELQASSADVWHTDGYMEPELQPAPLNLSKKPSTATRPKQSVSDKPARAKLNANAVKNAQPSKNTSKPAHPLIDTAPPQYHERIKSYESGFVPLPGSLLYEADKNTNIIRIPRSLSSSSNSSSSVSAIITPSKPGPAKGTSYPFKRPERRAHEPMPARSMNQMYDAAAASNISQLQFEPQHQPQPQTGKQSPTLSDLDEFFGVGQYEKAFLEKHPEAAKPFVLPPRVLETAESPVFTTPTLRRRDVSIQQHRELPQHTAERVMERKPVISTNVSSFALHRAQGNKATILPVIEGRSRANTTTARERDTSSKQDDDYEDSISEEHVPQHTHSENAHRFSLQRYDISTRRPSTAHARPSTFFDRPVPLPPAANVAPEAKKMTNTPATTLGSLFRRRNRNRTEPQQTQQPQPPQLQPQTQPRPQPVLQTPQQAPITPTILTTPRLPVHQPIGQWQPFREERSPFAGSTTRISGDEQSPYERQRIKYFREQTARALTGEIEPPRPPARAMGAAPWATVGFEAGRRAHGQRTMNNNNNTWASDGRRGTPNMPGRQISNPVTRTGLTNDWVNQGLPSPAPTTPLPPVPARPSGSGRQIPGTRSAPRPSASAAAAAPAPAGTLTGAVTGAGYAPAQPGQGGQTPSHRNRNPLGLRVETTAWKLRKASKEVLRSGRNVSGQHDGGSK